MAKRGVNRRLPGEEPDFPALMHRPYAMPLSEFNLADIDVAALRRKLELSQKRFAHRFGFPVATLRHWEQGTRKPRGCALALLHVIAYQPSVATRAILRAKRLGKGLVPPGSAHDFAHDLPPDDSS
jgi:putative transcriptional regulator